jgi:hypothetical protein
LLPSIPPTHPTPPLPLKIHNIFFVKQSKTDKIMVYLVNAGFFNPTSATPNKNGEMPLYLNGINGILPERARVLDGTVARNLGIEPGNNYMLGVTPTGTNEYGTTFAYSNMGKVSAMEMLQANLFKLSTNTPPQQAVSAPQTTTSDSQLP